MRRGAIPPARRGPMTEQSELSSQHGASHAVMGRDRSMGPGWITVTRESIASDERLAFWVGVAMEHNRAAGSADAG